MAKKSTATVKNRAATTAQSAAILCPNCGNAPLDDDGSVFYEKGEWDGKSYEEEGSASAYHCKKCGTKFAVIEDGRKTSEREECIGNLRVTKKEAEAIIAGLKAARNFSEQYFMFAPGNDGDYNWGARVRDQLGQGKARRVIQKLKNLLEPPADTKKVEKHGK